MVFLTTLIWRFDYHYSNSCALKDVCHRHKTKSLALSGNYFKMWQPVRSHEAPTRVPQQSQKTSHDNTQVCMHILPYWNKMFANFSFSWNDIQNYFTLDRLSCSLDWSPTPYAAKDDPDSTSWELLGWWEDRASPDSGNAGGWAWGRALYRTLASRVLKQF